MQPASGEEPAPLPVRPVFPGWALPPQARPVPDGAPWAEVTPDLLRDLLDALEDL